MTKLNSKELRDIPFTDAQTHREALKRNPMYLILENVYDTYNIGGLFRLADALAVEKIYLCGKMETPPHHKIQKASVGTYKIVPWEYKETALEAIEELKNIKNGYTPRPSGTPLKGETFFRSSLEGGGPAGGRVFHDKIQIIAIEQSEKSKPYTQIDYSFPVALLVGNETFGVLPETLEKVDHIVEIPMWGINKSLNVIVSAGIVTYEIMRNIK